MPRFLIEREIPNWAESEDLILEPSRRSKFPENRIVRVRRIIDPTTAER